MCCIFYCLQCYTVMVQMKTLYFTAIILVSKFDDLFLQFSKSVVHDTQNACNGVQSYKIFVGAETL